jgi:hypothetical protein
MSFMHRDKIKFVGNKFNPISFLEFLESAVLLRSGWCIKYWHDGCGTCGSIPFKRKLNKYSDMVILEGLNELLRRESETWLVNVIGVRNKDEKYCDWVKYRFDDAIGLCLEKISENTSVQALEKIIEGTPLGNFREQKIRIKNNIHKNYLERQKKQKKIEDKNKERKLIKQGARLEQHSKRVEKYEKRSKDLEI